jgi:hypothetical protein
VLRPTLTVGVQAVINVNCSQAALARIRNLRERVQYYGRIHAAAETYDNAAWSQMFKAGVQGGDQLARAHVRMVPEALAPDILAGYVQPSANRGGKSLARERGSQW